MPKKIPDFKKYSCLENSIPKYCGFLQKIWPHSAEYSGVASWNYVAGSLEGAHDFLDHVPFLNPTIQEEIDFLLLLADSFNQE